MGKKNKPADKTLTPTAKLTHHPFAELAGAIVVASPVATPTSVPSDDVTHATDPTPRPADKKKKSRGRLVLRRETKHRGGKAVIVVSGFDALSTIDDSEVSALAKELKQQLGCGGTVESTREIVLQGDRPAKVAELLRAQGFRVDGDSARRSRRNAP